MHLLMGYRLSVDPRVRANRTEAHNKLNNNKNSLSSNTEDSGPHNSLCWCRWLRERTNLFTEVRQQRTILSTVTWRRRIATNRTTGIEPIPLRRLHALTDTVHKHRSRRNLRHLVKNWNFKNSGFSTGLPWKSYSYPFYWPIIISV